MNVIIGKKRTKKKIAKNMHRSKRNTLKNTPFMQDRKKERESLTKQAQFKQRVVNSVTFNGKNCHHIYRMWGNIANVETGEMIMFS